MRVTSLSTLEEDDEGAYILYAFFVELNERYAGPFGPDDPTDAADRVVFVVRPTTVGKR